MKGARSGSLDYFVDCTLMRPRFLLSFFNHARGFAVNRRHEKIQEEDIISGLNSFSNDLLIDISLELRDVFPAGENLPYIFINANADLRSDDIDVLLKRFDFAEIEVNKAIEILLWHSVLGVKKPDGEIAYVHIESYDMRRLRMLLQDTEADDPNFVIHPAFRPSLDIQSNTEIGL